MPEETAKPRTNKALIKDIKHTALLKLLQQTEGSFNTTELLQVLGCINNVDEYD